MPLGDSPDGVRMQRACNYFALLELLGHREPPTRTAWQHLQGRVDLSRPLDPGVGAALGRLDWDPTTVQTAHAKVARDLNMLADGDGILELGSPDYPERLAATGDAPPFLFVRGDPGLLNDAAIAVVGTREATDQGRRRALKLGHLLAERGVVVTSGLARGIDRAAHVGALETGGLTIAVIGTPLTAHYPKEHAELQETIGALGAVVSQFRPGATVHRSFFPKRNATMSGLCLGTVVVEASETSGALIQARQCLAQGRKLFIPQSALDDRRLRWPARFMEQGAHRFATIEELLDVLEKEGLLAPKPPSDTAGSADWPRAEVIPLHVR